MADSQHASPRFTPDVDFLGWYRGLLRRSYIVVAAATLGGLLGLTATRFISPKYRATAVLDIGVDYGRSRWLDEDADRLALDRVQALILSDQVLAEVADHVVREAEGAPDELEPLREELRLVWVDSRWELSYTAPDPQQAARVANLWAETALEQLRQATQHAWRAAESQSLYFRVYCRPESLASNSAAGLWVCDEREPGLAPADLPAELLADIEASQGIIPALSFGWQTMATVPERPISAGRLTLTLSGLLVGLLVGSLAAARARP